MKKRNIPIIVLIIVGFILIVISCSRSQAQGLPADQPAAQVDQAADDHAEAEAEHQETDDTHMDDHGHGPEEHMAGSHGVPEDAAAVENPMAATDESIAAGAAIFAQNCAVCHGENGQGNGPLAGTLDKQPANLHESHVQDLSDGALFWIVSHGRSETPMPPWDRVLSEQQRWQVVNFLRTFADGDTQAAGEAAEEHDHATEVEEGHHGDETEEEHMEQLDSALDEDAEGHTHGEADAHADDEGDAHEDEEAGGHTHDEADAHADDEGDAHAHDDDGGAH